MGLGGFGGRTKEDIEARLDGSLECVLYVGVRGNGEDIVVGSGAGIDGGGSGDSAGGIVTEALSCSISRRCFSNCLS